MLINTDRVIKYLRHFNFPTLFIEELGWERHSATLDTVVDGQLYSLRAVAQKRGLVAFTCSPAPDGRIPPETTRREIERYVATLVHEHLIVFHDKGCAESIWQWVYRESATKTCGLFGNCRGGAHI